MNYTHLVSVAALVVNEEREVLLIKSPDRGWEYPGGIVEPHETLQEALFREVEEETGVQIEIISFVGISKILDRDIVNIDFVCKYTGGDLQTSNESLEVKWVSKEQAFELVQYPLTQKRLKNMLSCETKMYCFGFKKEPFQVMDEADYPIGLM